MYRIYTKKFGIPEKLYPKLLLIMRLTTVILLASLLQVSASTFGQRITINQKNVALESVLKEIRKQSGYGYYYGNDVIPEKQKINIAVTNASLEEALSTALQGLELRFEIEDKVIVIKKKEPSFLDSLVDRFQAIDVRGKVVDSETGEGLPGATVKVKGLNKSVSTGKDGDFFLDNVNEDAVLEISYIGYVAKMVKVSNDVGTIWLEMAMSDLQEVTINKGYYTETKGLSTSSVGQISSEEIERQPVSNPLIAIQGRMPGVFIQQTSGIPGTKINIQIRGRNSIANGNEPFFIVDGVPFTSDKLSSENVSNIFGVSGVSPLNSLNPGDIENIEVLKDADATAIYGSRGANGVVLITTKRGKAGKTSLDVNYYRSYSEVTKYLNLLSTPQYLEMRREGFANDGIIPDITSAPDLFKWDTTRYTNWQKELIGGTAKTNSVQSSLSGGNEDTKFLFNSGYYQESSVFPGPFMYQKFSSLFSVNHNSRDNKLATHFSVNYVFDKNNLPVTDIT
ncbi:MAG: SusC/RagA family TonB-linked outer membrane protein, partial [Pedobacter sp.]